MPHHHSSEDNSSRDAPSQNPFTEGSTLSLTVEHACNIPASLGMEVTVIKLIQPVTISPVIEVMLKMKSGLETKAVLKLYDRRFATGLRRRERAQPWTPTTEELYKQYVLQGRAEKLFEVLDESSDDEGSGDGDSDDTDSGDEEERDPNLKIGQTEGYLHHYCGELYAKEVRAYESLRDLQGQSIPKFLASVRVQSPADTEISQHFHEYFDVRGILIEFIEGFSLFDLKTKVPQSQWQAICEDAIRVVNLVGDHGVLNHDVRPENFLVKSKSGGNYQVFQIDFAQSEYRDGLSWEVWRERKACLDEEGAVGLVMQKLLKGGFKYRRSYKYYPDRNNKTN